ncbi:MAG: response regulator transcription factor [Anaerolineales bacterium]|nr:response regulator transcription factor [Anaerolineales bacterium]
MEDPFEEITIVVVDDHPLFRQGVADALTLELGFKIIGQASSGDEALAQIRALRPDVAVVDINLPGMNGQQVTHQVVQEKLPTRIVLLTAYDDREQILHAAWAGAAAYCSKDVDPASLIRAIHEVVLGKYVIEDQVFTRRELERWLERQMEKARHLYSEPGSPFHPLSEREMEVLSCVVHGMSNKEIAISLGISHQTVKNHVTSILRKFGVEDRTQAVVYALKRGWVKLNDQEPKE